MTEISEVPEGVQGMIDYGVTIEHLYPGEMEPDLAEKVVENKFVDRVIENADYYNYLLDLPIELGLANPMEVNYVTVLIGKELIADKQARRRHSDIPEEEMTDDQIRRLGVIDGVSARLVNRRVLRDESAYDELVTSFQEKIAASIGEGREKMIRFAIHDIFSNALHEGRKSERGPKGYVKRYERRPHKPLMSESDFDRRAGYWKKQIANPPVPTAQP